MKTPAQRLAGYKSKTYATIQDHVRWRIHKTHYNPACSHYGEKHCRWVENASEVLRFVGYVQELRHSPAPHIGPKKTLGWYADNFQGSTYYPVVYQLPSRNKALRFAYGYADPHNSGAAFLSFDPCDSLDDAQRWACSLTKSAAEDAREDDAKFQAEQQIADLESEVAKNRTKIINLCREARLARASQPAFPTLCAAIREKVSNLVDSIRDARAKRNRLTEDPWEAVTQ